MTPQTETTRLGLPRRGFLGLGLSLCWLSGCSSPLIRGQSPETDELIPDEIVDYTRYIKDMANSYGLFGLKIEGIALATGLDNTGSNPPDDHRRQALIDDMQSRSVPSPQQLLASPTTSLVLVQAVLPPATRKGDRLDVTIRTPSNSQTTSLRGGWSMPTRLREMEVLGGSIRTGHVVGLAEGYVLVESAYKDGNPKVLENRGRILGTAVSHMNRPIGLAISEDYQSVEAAAAIGAAVNARFQVFESGRKSGVANPKRSSFVELILPRQYKGNVERFMAVVRNIAIRETPTERVTRLRALEAKLLEPTTAAQTALQLEAIGRDSIPTLKKGLQCPDIEVRFVSAEALAYLGVSDGCTALGEAARDVAAFRWGALNALTVLDEVADSRASDVLLQLLHTPSAETRYGAFRALRSRNPFDPYVRGEVLGEDRFGFHVVTTTGEPLVHFSLSQRPELVVFGNHVRITPPPFLFVNKQVLIKRIDDDRVKISRFQPGHDDQYVECSSDLVELVPALVKAGASYQDVMLAMRKAKKEEWLDCRLAFDAVPRPKRAYYRDEFEHGTGDGESGDPHSHAASSDTDDSNVLQRETARDSVIDYNSEEDKPQGFWSRWFGKITLGPSP